MLAKAILVHGDIGYKFCWLLPSEDQNQGTPVDWTPINRTYTSWTWNQMASLSGKVPTIEWYYQSTCDFHHKFGDFSFILVTLLIISSTCSYFSISFNVVLVNLSLFVVLFSFVFVFVTDDTSCVCQIGYEIVEEGLWNLKHLITRNWNWAWTSWKLHLKISIVTMVIRTIPMHSDQWGTACIHLVWVHHHV